MNSFAQRVVAWQRIHGRHGLPWQDTRDPYRIWLSEIMLQQTQVTAVVPYYQRFLASFPDVASLARAPLDDVLAHWSGLGYYRRAHMLHAAAKEIIRDHAGEFPRDVAAIAMLPGVGRSTAAAIAVFAFGTQAVILEGNVKRVLARHRGIGGWPGVRKVEMALWKAATGLAPSRDIETYTQGMMDLGATVCTRAAPRCGECPLAADCVARAENRVDTLPSPRPRRQLPQRSVRVLLIERDGAILFEKRPAIGIWGGLWSLPECAIEADVNVAVVARFGHGIRMLDALPSIEHGFTHFALTMHPQRAQVAHGNHVAQTSESVWMTPHDASAAALPAPIKRLMRALAHQPPAAPPLQVQPG